MNSSQDPLAETTLESQRVYEGAFLKVNKDVIALPNGKQSYREYVCHPGAVAVIAICNDGSLVFERQWRHPLHRAFFEIPAGKIDNGEDPLLAAQRELREETGYVAKKWQHIGTLHTSIAYTNEFIEIYLATGLTLHERKLDEGEFLELHYFSVEKLNVMVSEGKITDAKTLAALHLAQSFLRLCV